MAYNSLTENPYSEDNHLGDKIAPPSNKVGEPYLDGSAGPAHASYCNAGRDQDRSRQDECQEASYHYVSGATGHEAENETGMVEGY